MINLKNIAEGWGKHIGVIDVPPAQKTIARYRVSICVECPKAKEHWVSKLIDGALKKDEIGSGIGCGICGCPVMQKALVMAESCPLKKW